MHTNYHPIFQFPHLKKSLDKHDQFLSTYIKSIESVTKANTFQKKIFSLIPDKIIFSFFGSSSDILFLTPSFPDLFAIKTHYRIKLLSATSFSNLLSQDENMSHFPVYFFYKKLLFFYKTDPLLKSKKAKKFISDTTRWLQSSSIKDIVVQNDSLFVERFLILCAKNANIKSICIQHGIFWSGSQKELIEGKAADYFFAWDEVNAQIIRQNSNTKVKILGYPHNIDNNQNTNLNKNKICLLGQPYENYNLELGKKKQQVFSELGDLLIDSYETVVYKPHPAEKNTHYFPSELELFTGSLSDAIEQYDVFISLTSTALLEVTLANKIAIQIFHEEFKSDNFQKNGYSYTIDSKELNKIIPYIASLDSSFLPFCKMPVYENIAQRFIDLLKEIQ